ncbi:uncharacterized protein METZ01_LOCUS225192, partial [marine metagenome]
GILLEAIFGDSYSITFGDGLVTVKPQPVTSNFHSQTHYR